MLFGFTVAVIVGFLFTAGRNWSNQPTPTGLHPGRAGGAVGRRAGAGPHAFRLGRGGRQRGVPAGGGRRARDSLRAAGNKRNYFFVGLLALMSRRRGFVHLAQLGVVALPAWPGIQIAWTWCSSSCRVMGGRVIPMFTNNGVPGADATRKPVLEKVALGSVLALLAADALRLGRPLAAWPRWLAPRTWRAGRCGSPGTRCARRWSGCCIAAYLWIPVHLALRALAELGWCRCRRPPTR